jgi:hypothetical protein
MSRKINPIIFRKNSKGFYLSTNKSSVLNGLQLSYSSKNHKQFKHFFNNFFLFFSLNLDSLLYIETNNSIYFISFKYHSNILKKNVKQNKLLKQTIIKGLLFLAPIKTLYLRGINNKKIFFPKNKKKNLIRTLKGLKFFCCDPFNLIKTLRYSFFNSRFFASIIAKELKMIKKQHNKFLNICGKILRLSIKNKINHSNLKGVRICFKGKFNGRLRAKTKTLQVGVLSLQKMLSVIDFCSVKSTAPEGVFGIKVWFCY